jgi:peptidoglycan hydrolase-like protein with peptidoglycan-binding domain
MAGPGLFGTESEETVGAFQEQTHVTFPLLLRDTTRGQLAFSDASISPYPLDVILDRDGTIVYLRREFDIEAMNTTLEQLLD